MVRGLWVVVVGRDWALSCCGVDGRFLGRWELSLPWPAEVGQGFTKEELIPALPGCTQLRSFY